MDRTALEALKTTATEARDLAHKAYEIALQNRKAEGDTRPAYDALLKANAVLHAIDRMIIEAITAEIDAKPAPVAAPAPELHRVWYVTSGLRRRVKTVTAETLEWMRGASHTGIRVTSSRQATVSEIRKGEWRGILNG